MDWQALGAIGTVLGSLLVAASFYFLAVQVREVQRATYAQAFFTAAARLQDEELRKARGEVFRIHRANPSIPSDRWEPAEKKTAETVCHNYDVVGILVRSHMLPEQMIVDSWGDSIRQLWPILQPLVAEYRRTREAPEFWDDFEYLYDRALALYVKRRKAYLSSARPQAA